MNKNNVGIAMLLIIIVGLGFASQTKQSELMEKQCQKVQAFLVKSCKTEAQNQRLKEANAELEKANAEAKKQTEKLKNQIK